MKGILAILVLLSLGFCFFPKGSLTPEEAIQATIQNAAEAARRARPGDFMDQIAESFEAKNMSRSSLRAFVTRRLLAHGGLAVHLGEIQVRHVPGASRADATFQATFPESLDSSRPDLSETREFRLDLIEEDGEWLIVYQENQQL